MLDYCEICNNYRPLEEYHIKSRSKGGSENRFNKTNICSNCHKLVHYGLIIIEGYFQSTLGNRLVWRKLNEESVTGFSDPEVYIIPNSYHIRENYLKRKN